MTGPVGVSDISRHTSGTHFVAPPNTHKTHQWKSQIIASNSLAWIRLEFCIGAIVTPSGNKMCKKVPGFIVPENQGRARFLK